ncbi:O-antigen ligase family protein [Pseudarthrobacter oxydans]|uniref:O-antigen ligase family protein n=1 Tax=Pseudarthrobacter oxydans TaxID=1671 RepID=UPI0038010D67
MLATAGSAIFAALSVVSPSTALIGFIGIIVFVIVLKKPDALIFLTLASATITLPAFVPTSFSAGSVTVKLYEPLLMLSVVYSAFRYKNRAPMALGAFAILILGWGAAGLLAGHEPSKIIYDTRNLIMLLAACFVACKVAGTDITKRLVPWVTVVLWVSAAMTLLASATSLPLSGRSEEAALPVSGAAATDSALRLISPGTHLALAVLCVAAVLVVAKKCRAKDVLQLVLPAVFLVFVSFSRNSILGISVAILFALLASRNVRSTSRTAVYTLCASAAFWILTISSSLLANLPGGAWVDKQVGGFSERVLGGLTSDTLAVDNSAQFRFQMENALIIPRIEESPLLGHGFGYAYKLPSGVPGSFTADFAPYYAHNFYLWILVKAGALGLILFLWLALAPTLRLLRTGPISSHAVGGATAALLATSFVAPIPIGSPTALIFGALIGCCYAFQNSQSQSQTRVVVPYLKPGSRAAVATLRRS